jgi:pseudouridine synthase
MSEKIRLQKYLSQSGICSRRKGEEYIEKGLIRVNGQIATLGMSIDPSIDKVELSEEEIKAVEKLVYYKLNKPRGIVTTCAQDDQRSILDIIDIPERVFPVGRLDKDTTGLILMTNDGRLANYLMHPKYEHQKEYVVETFWPISDEELVKMSEGVEILWKLTNKSPITRYSSGSFSIILTEWRNRQIRRMVEVVWHKVKKLKRIRIENILLGDLPIGRYLHLSKKELEDLWTHLWLKLI